MSSVAKNKADSIVFSPERVTEAKENVGAITNREVSEAIGVSEKHISEVFNGKAGVSFGVAV